MLNDHTTHAVVVAEQAVVATRAGTDAALIQSWLDGMASPRTRTNFAITASRFKFELDALGLTLRTAAVEDVRDALKRVTEAVAPSTGRQYTARIKSLLSYAHRLGYTRFNAGTVIRLPGNVQGERSANIAKRSLGETEVALLLRAAASNSRNLCLFGLTYAGGLRASELLALRWIDVMFRPDGTAQISVTGKGGKQRQVMIGKEPADLLVNFQNHEAITDQNNLIFHSRRRDSLSQQAVHQIIKVVAAKASVTGSVSMHWLRHAHASHALDRRVSLAVLKESLGHASIATTSVYLHAKPGDGSGLHLDGSIFAVARAKS